MLDFSAMRRFRSLVGLTLAWLLASAAGPTSHESESYPPPASTRFT